MIAIIFMAVQGASAGDGTGGKGKNKGPAAGGNNKEGVEFILQHEKDLDLTADQVKKLEDVSAKVNTQREKLRDDPEMQELYKDAKEAQDSGDKDAIRAARKKIREAVEKKSGLKVENVIADVAKILNPKQLKKLAELRKENGMENPAKTAAADKQAEKEDANHKKADVAKGPPNLYDNEK
jgi:hypothetical protein